MYYFLYFKRPEKLIVRQYLHYIKEILQVYRGRLRLKFDN